MEALKQLTNPKFVVPVAIVAAVVSVLSVYVWNNHAVPKIQAKTGNDYTA